MGALQRPRLIASTFMSVFLLLPLLSAVAALETIRDYKFGPFNSSYYQTFSVESPATISNEALQITPDSAGNFSLSHRSGRVLFNQSFKLWETGKKGKKNKVASFNTSFLVNVFRVNFSEPGEGFAFLIAPDLHLPPGSDGQYLGLTNSTADGKSSNQLLAIELDTVKQDFDPDSNHLGLNINSIRSNKTVSLSKHGIQIAPNGTKYYVVWVEYDGVGKILDVYMAEQGRRKPPEPMLSSVNLDLKDIVNQYSYFGFAASTGEKIELHCVLRWNLTVEMLKDDRNTGQSLKIGLAVGVSILLVLIVVTGVAYYLYRKRKAASDPKILGTLRSLPGTPREFGYKELKKATNNFDDKHKLGQGGFGVVYRGLVSKENLEIAVKKFSRDNIQSKDDFLAELSIINRLRHKHLVRLLGWCHKNGMLLLVYDYMPNGSLDNHIFCGPESNISPLGWSRRYKIIWGVASALNYLHNEYDQKVVHRDLKASNILLDSNFNARLGDFGLARAIENGKTSYAELEGVPGTMGYIAPECFHTGKATRESDIYGFGAVVLEVVCGQRPWTKIGGYQFLVDWVWSLHREGRILEAVDERLGGEYVAEEAQRLLLLGLACSHPNVSERPTTQAIVQVLSGSVPVPQVPPFKPAFIWPSSPMPDISILATKSQDTTPISSSRFDSGWSWTPHCDSKDNTFQNIDSPSLR